MVFVFILYKCSGCWIFFKKNFPVLLLFLPILTVDIKYLYVYHDSYFRRLLLEQLCCCFWVAPGICHVFLSWLQEFVIIKRTDGCELSSEVRHFQTHYLLLWQITSQGLYLAVAFCDFYTCLMILPNFHHHSSSSFEHSIDCVST